VQPAAGAAPCKLDPSPGFFRQSPLSNAKFLARWARLALILLARPAFLFADDNAPRAKDTVIVPYDPKTPVKEQHPDKVYLDYDRFLELWEAAKKTRTAEKVPPAAEAFALSAARYEGRV